MMAGEKKQRRIDRIDGRTVLFLTLCACLRDFFDNKFLGHGIFTFWIFLSFAGSAYINRRWGALRSIWWRLYG